MWWEHTLDWLYDSPLLSICSWCVVSAYTWLALWLSLLSTCSWCVVRAYTWLVLWLSLLSTCSWCVVRAYTWLVLWLSLLSTCSWCVVSALARCPVAAVASSKWMLHTGGGWGETPLMIVKRFGCTAIHNKVLYKCIIHSFMTDHVLFIEACLYNRKKYKLWHLFSQIWLFIPTFFLQFLRKNWSCEI